jgi:putative DNA primase/helicase
MTQLATNAQPTTMLDAALAYAATGWAVFPCVPRGKRPLTASGFKDATTDADQIRAWWTEFPDANVAIATGERSNVDVLDADIKPWKGARGDLSLFALISEHGALPETRYQRTWSGGLQYFFKHSPGVRNSAGKVGDHLDIRGDGGYVVVAPSVVEDDGQAEGTYMWESDAQLASMPPWLFDLCSSATKGSKGSKGSAEAKSLKAGKMRNSSLISLAGSMKRRGMSLQAIRAALHVENRQSANPLDDEEVEGVAASIERYEPGTESENDPGGERFTDYANALRLEEVATGRAGHVDEMKDKWYVFEGGRLVLKSKAAMYPFNAEVAERLFVEANLEDARRKEFGEQLRLDGNLDPDALQTRLEESEARSTALRAGAHKMESRTGGDAAIELAKATPGLRLQLKQLDAHPTWLNTPNGTLDLNTGELHAHRFDDLLTKITGVTYDPDARCPRWDSFLEEVIPDLEVRAFLQRSLGLALTDITREQCLWFLYGRGRNGKTTLLNAVRHVLGDYGSSTKASTLMIKQHGDDKRNDIAVLRGTRFVSATETEDGQRMAEALIKEMTGEDPVTARLLYAEFFSFHPTFKIFLAANHKPIISGVDLAIWRRIHLVPFEQTIPEEKVDGLLPVALQAEGPGILNWLIAGYRAYVERGLQVPQAVRAATAAYRHESDPLADFLEDACFVEPGVECTARALYDAYTRWAQTNGVRLPLKARSLGQQLAERGFQPTRGSGGVRGWRGLRPRV